MKLYDSVAGTADFLAGSTDEAVARQFDSTEGGGFIERGPVESATNPLDLQYRLATGTADYLGAVRSDPRYFSDGSQEAMRESFQLTGASRDVFDVVSDYEGEWGGEVDSFDFVGPAVAGREGSLLDAVSSTPGEEVSTTERKSQLLVWGVVAAVGLYLLAPLLDAFSSVVDATTDE